jgi:hypothetical protein
MLFQDNGYPIKSSDKDLLSITTDMYENHFYGNGFMGLSIYISGEESAKIYLTRQYAVPVVSSIPNKIDFRGTKASTARNAFDKMHEGAKLLYGWRQ